MLGVAVTLLCGVNGGLVAFVSKVAAHTAVITGHVPVLLIDATSPQQRGRQHPQGRVHMLVDMVAERSVWSHRLLEAVAGGYHCCSLRGQHVRWYLCMTLGVSVKVRGWMCWSSTGEVRGHGGGPVGLVRRVSLGEVAAIAQACDLEERWRNTEHLVRCCHLVAREE